MAAVRGRDTGPELAVRRGLHALGFRYGLRSKLPGRPDLVLPAKGAAVFVHGCFWHAHACPRAKLPASNRIFWAAKLRRNAARDRACEAALLAAGWRVATVWECAIRADGAATVARLARWLSGRRKAIVIGRPRDPRTARPRATWEGGTERRPKMPKPRPD